ncbi:MAG: hypothetical protein ACR2KE_06620 [Candidatus Nanopelagicales bacterium]
MKQQLVRWRDCRRQRLTQASIRQIWDRERAKAMSPSHRAEIDAIFSRYL